MLTGKSTDDLSVPADQIKKAGISKVIVVGIGRVPSEDLRNTASNAQNALVSPSYPQLPDRVADVIALINAGNSSVFFMSIELKWLCYVFRYCVEQCLEDGVLTLL